MELLQLSWSLIENKKNPAKKLPDKNNIFFPNDITYVLIEVK